MRVLWAVSSVGLGHVMRDLAVVGRLERANGAQVDWLAPPPAGDFLRRRGCTVLPESDRLEGSGRTYARVFAGRTDFNLMPYVRADTRLHRHDFLVSAGTLSPFSAKTSAIATDCPPEPPAIPTRLP